MGDIDLYESLDTKDEAFEKRYQERHARRQREQAERVQYLERVFAETNRVYPITPAMRERIVRGLPPFLCRNAGSLDAFQALIASGFSESAMCLDTPYMGLKFLCVEDRHWEPAMCMAIYVWARHVLPYVDQQHKKSAARLLRVFKVAAAFRGSVFHVGLGFFDLFMRAKRRRGV
jgi:hypothetical protein